MWRHEEVRTVTVAARLEQDHTGTQERAGQPSAASEDPFTNKEFDVFTNSPPAISLPCRPGAETCGSNSTRGVRSRRSNVTS
jgi:hypothetical protein